MDQFYMSLLTPVFTGLVATAAAIATAYLRQFIALKATSQDISIINDAIKFGASVTYGELAKKGASVEDAAALSAALQKGVAYVLNQVPAKLEAVGVSPAEIPAKVEARFGELLSFDPSVTVAKDAAASVVQAVGAAALR